MHLTCATLKWKKASRKNFCKINGQNNPKFYNDMSTYFWETQCLLSKVNLRGPNQHIEVKLWEEKETRDNLKIFKKEATQCLKNFWIN
jgi:hypothetical protein